MTTACHIHAHKWLTLPRIFCPGMVTDFHQTHSPSCDLGISDLRSDRTHCSHFTWGAHMTTCTAKSYCWIRGNFLDSSRKTNWISISVTRMRFEPGFPGRVRFGITTRPNWICSGEVGRVDSTADDYFTRAVNMHIISEVQLSLGKHQR